MNTDDLTFEEKEKRILSIHEELYQFLLAWRGDNPDFYFTLRKTNRYQRLEKGYWFYGDENTIYFSFWNGFDWKSRTPVVSFSVNLKEELWLSLAEPHEKERLNNFRNLISVLSTTTFSSNLERSQTNKGVFYTKLIGNHWKTALTEFLKSDWPRIHTFLNSKTPVISSNKDFALESAIAWPISEKEWKNQLRKIELYRISIGLNESSSKFTTAITEIKIADFKGIKQTEIKDLPDTIPWIIVTGENGSGKSSFLQAIAIGLHGNVDGKRIMEDSEFSIEVSYFHGGKKTKHFRTRDSDYRSPNNSKNLDSTSTLGAVSGLKFLCAYGPHRVYLQHNFISESPEAVIWNLFYDEPQLLYIEESLSRWFFKQSDPEFQSKFESIKETILDLLGENLADLEVDIKTDEVLFTEIDNSGKLYPKLPSKKLASGYRSIIAMIGDMILRLFKSQPGITDPSELKGIVIIDEIDVHFHPRLQRDFPKRLSETFPKIQFIASTHSPIPILGAPEGSVFIKMERTQDEGITARVLNIDVSNLLPNAILTSPIFGLEGDEIEAVTNKDSEKIVLEDDYQEYLKQKELDDELKAFDESEEEYPEYLFRD